jgi:hypothetical protein
LYVFGIGQAYCELRLIVFCFLFLLITPANRIVAYQPAPIVFNGDLVFYGVAYNTTSGPGEFSVGGIVAELNQAPVAANVKQSAYVGYMSVRTLCFGDYQSTLTQKICSSLVAQP